MIIKKIGNYERFNELKEQVLELCATVMTHKQLSLQYDVFTGDRTWLNAWGFDKAKREHYYSKIQPMLEGTEIDIMFKTIKIPMFRTRIFSLDPNTIGYEPHKDPTARIHIPITTGPGANFYSYEPDERIGDFMPADGSIYYVDARVVHTFKNFSNVQRIHIVGSYYGDDIWP